MKNFNAREIEALYYSQEYWNDEMWYLAARARMRGEKYFVEGPFVKIKDPQILSLMAEARERADAAILYAESIFQKSLVAQNVVIHVEEKIQAENSGVALGGEGISG